MSARKIYRIPNTQESKLLLDYFYVIVFENKREIAGWRIFLGKERKWRIRTLTPNPDPHVFRDKRILPLPSPSSALFF